MICSKWYDNYVSRRSIVYKLKILTRNVNGADDK